MPRTGSGLPISQTPATGRGGSDHDSDRAAAAWPWRGDRLAVAHAVAATGGGEHRRHPGCGEEGGAALDPPMPHRPPDPGHADGEHRLVAHGTEVRPHRT